VAGLELVLADMGVERQAESLGEALGELGRTIAVAAERAALEVTYQARMRLLEIEPVGDRNVGDGADVALDEVQAENAERPQVRPGVEARYRVPAEQREEFIERADAGTAGFDV